MNNKTVDNDIKKIFNEENILNLNKDITFDLITNKNSIYNKVNNDYEDLKNMISEIDLIKKQIKKQIKSEIKSEIKK